MARDITSRVFQIIQQQGPMSVKAIVLVLKKDHGIKVGTDDVNSLLYGPLHEQLVRDKDEDGYPLWRIKIGRFEAAKGLEVMFFQELLRKKILQEDEAQLGYRIHNRRNGKTYDLDLAVFRGGLKLDIEIDGFEHIRADAMLRIQEQIEQKGEKTEIEIDWMDNRTSYTDFKLIDNKRLFRWFAGRRDWMKLYHEELIKPHDITRNIWLIENGWRIMRFWNFEIKEELDRCLKEVHAYLPPRS